MDPRSPKTLLQNKPGLLKASQDSGRHHLPQQTPRSQLTSLTVTRGRTWGPLAVEDKVATQVPPHPRLPGKQPEPRPPPT